MRSSGPGARRPVAAALLLAVTAAGCGRGPLELGAGHDERLVRAQSGEAVIIRLEENPGAGFEWRFAEEPDPAVLELLSRDHEPPDDPAPGAGGTAVWRFRASAPGSTRLVLEYAATFDPTAVADTYTLDFEVATERS